MTQISESPLILVEESAFEYLKRSFLFTKNNTHTVETETYLFGQLFFAIDFDLITKEQFEELCNILFEDLSDYAEILEFLNFRYQTPKISPNN